jgi:uncharacterized protein
MDNQNSFLGTEEQPIVPPTSDEKTLAILCHILTFVAWFIAPLIIFLIKKDDSKFVADHAKESINFQITIFLASIVAIILMIVIIGIFLIWAIGILDLVLVIVATVRAGEGKIYRYPFCIRLIK